jgi:hypothetical protein
MNMVKLLGGSLLMDVIFREIFQSDLSGIVINESAAAILGLENPVGESLSW